MMDVIQTHCENCEKDFRIEIPRVESTRVKFCPSCGMEIKNPVYYEDFGNIMKIRLDDGSLFTVT